jgi:hypothetical protein
MSAARNQGPDEPCPRVRRDLVCVVLDDELVVYDPRAQTLHHLNAAATLVWDQCNGRRTVPNIAEAIARRSGVAVDVVLRDVVDLLQRLRAAELLVDPGNGAVAPDGATVR